MVTYLWGYVDQCRQPVALSGRYGEQHEVAGMGVDEHPSATDECVGVQGLVRVGEQQASGQVVLVCGCLQLPPAATCWLAA